MATGEKQVGNRPSAHRSWKGEVRRRSIAVRTHGRRYPTSSARSLVRLPMSQPITLQNHVKSKLRLGQSSTSGGLTQTLSHTLSHYTDHWRHSVAYVRRVKCRIGKSLCAHRTLPALSSLDAAVPEEQLHAKVPFRILLTQIHVDGTQPLS